MNSSEREILAFCHIEKAAGTSLIHVLRQKYSTGYVDARPLTRGRSAFFGRADFEILKKLRPGLVCIGGHAVVPHSDLMDAKARIRFITLLREPVSRVVSHYRFWVERMGSKFGPEEFLQHPVASNFQVRKIAGTNNVAKAIDVIRQHFVMVGTIEEFDEFLLLLAGQLSAPSSEMLYQSRNIADDKRATDLPVEFHERVAELNKLDRELYSWVRSELVPGYIRQYGSAFSEDLINFKQLQEKQNAHPVNSLAVDIVRNVYVKPLTGLIRVWNGIPYSGSYKDLR